MIFSLLLLRDLGGFQVDIYSSPYAITPLHHSFLSQDAELETKNGAADIIARGPKLSMEAATLAHRTLLFEAN